MNRCSSVLLGLDELVRAFQEMVQPSVFRKACLPVWVAWAVEVLTLLLCVVESCVRDGWVPFADLEGRKRKRQSQQNLVFSDERRLSGTKETMAGPSPASRLVSTTSNLLLMILLAGYSVTVPFFQEQKVTKPGFIILRYKEVGQFLSPNLSMIVLKLQLPSRSKVRGLTLAKVFLMAGLMSPNSTELQKEPTLQELVHPFCSTGFC